MNSLHQSDRKIGIVVMGTTGSGKSTITKAIATRLNCKVIEGDDFHTDDSRSKMAHGVGLTDEDRIPWLNEIAQQITKYFANNQNAQIVLIACSALKKKYRDLLNNCGTDDLKMGYLYLDGDFDILRDRINARESHFAKSNLLVSQFNDLEPPNPEEEVVETISINGTTEENCENGYQSSLKLIKKLQL